MTITETIDKDIKQAMLGGDKKLTEVLRTVKSAILYEAVARGARDQGLSDEVLIEILSKEIKKRQESAQLFAQGGNELKASDERWEQSIIEGYLPVQLSDEELMTLVTATVAQQNATSMQHMGMVIAAVKTEVKGTASGARIAQAVKEALSQ